MTPEEMDQVRPRLVAFAAEMLGGLARTDQRAKGALYLRGLLLDGKRKSMQPMAARLGVDHQQTPAVRDLLYLGPHRGPAPTGALGSRTRWRVRRPAGLDHR